MDDRKWNGWGSTKVAYDFRGREAESLAFLERALGTELTPAPSLDESALTLPPSRLDAELARAFSLAFEGRVHGDDHPRLLHARGRSYPDLLRLRRGELPDVPDLVLEPRTRDEVQAMLELADRERVAVVPFGAGSSVVGGVNALRRPHHRGLVALSTRRLDRVLDVDPMSLLAHVEAGIDGPSLERALADHELALGHVPQSFEFSTLGGWIAARGAGQLSTGDGPMASMVAGVGMATPRGRFDVKPFPQSAAGPDLTSLVLGSEGVLGVVTDAVVRVRKAPEARILRAYVFRHVHEGLRAVRKLAQEGSPADLVRLSDAAETAFFGGFRSIREGAGLRALGEWALDRVGFARKSVLLLGFEGSDVDTEARLAHATSLVRSCNALPVGEGPARSWWGHRFEMPYLRDALLDRGVGVETLETATRWSNLESLYLAVRDALSEAIKRTTPRSSAEPIVLAHVSHTYTDGASLYFTFLFAADATDPIAQWQTIKDAASCAIVRCGGTITHHHGVGTDHARELESEKGGLGIAMLEAVKRSVDPHGIMNPGKLLARAGDRA